MRKICAEIDCDKQAHGHGYCVMHYKRFKRHGTTEKSVYIPKNRKCSFNDCDKPHECFGYCVKHSRQFKKYGQPKTDEEMRVIVSKMMSERSKGNQYVLGKRWKMNEKKRLAMVGITTNTGKTHFKKGFTPWNKGLSGWVTEEHRQALIDCATGRTPWNKGKTMMQTQGEKNWIWAGDNVSYRSLHKWVQRHLGKPGECEQCDRKNLTEHQIHWSNISGDYLRDLEDWQRLCAKCHKAYDKQLRVARMRG